MVKQLFYTEPDLEDSVMTEEPISSRSRPKSTRRRPSLSIIHHEEEGSNKHTSSSSHSSFSSSAGSLGYRRTRHYRKVIPCTVLIDLIE